MLSENIRWLQRLYILCASLPKVGHRSKAALHAFIRSQRISTFNKQGKNASIGYAQRYAQRAIYTMH